MNQILTTDTVTAALKVCIRYREPTSESHEGPYWDIVVHDHDGVVIAERWSLDYWWRHGCRGRRGVPHEDPHSRQYGGGGWAVLTAQQWKDSVVLDEGTRPEGRETLMAISAGLFPGAEVVDRTGLPEEPGFWSRF